MKTDFPKINIFIAHTYKGKRYFSYVCSTNWSHTCREAVKRYYHAKYPSIALNDIKATFARI
jgi:hypothetical protein